MDGQVLRQGRTARAARLAAAAAGVGLAAQFLRARNGYPSFGDLDAAGEFGDSSRPALDIVMVGDSTCTGAGLHSADDIWIRQLLPRLTARHRVRIDTLARGGARVADIAARLDELPAGRRWHVAVVSVGANDALRGATRRSMVAGVGAVVDRMLEVADTALVVGMGDMGTSPRMLFPFDRLVRWRSWSGDRAHARVAADRARVFKVQMRPLTNDVFRARDDIWAGDRFHPNREGHSLWAEAIYPTLVLAIAASGAAPAAADSVPGAGEVHPVPE